MENDMKSSAEDDTPIVIEDDYGDINVEALERTMTTTRGRDSPLPAKCCIFRVPHMLRRHKPEIYTPDFVSIGPYHRGSAKQLKFMENVKQLYFNNLLSRLNISLTELIQGIDNITEFGKRARESYAEPLDNLSQNELIEMMILDGCFVIELLRKLFIKNSKILGKAENLVSPELEIENDPILNKDCMLQYLCHDLMLLENQLPWFVLEHLYSLTVGEYRHLPLIQLVMFFFFSSLTELTYSFGPFLMHTLGSHDDVGCDILHILDLARTALVFNFQELGSSPIVKVKLPSATMLSEAGVKFQKGLDEFGPMNVYFKNGVLTIPHLTIGELTEPLFKNLIAFEQCCHGRSHKITSYVFLMNGLINSRKDIDFLCEKNIVFNRFSSENASQLFNRLYNDTVIRDFSYGEVCHEVNEYCRKSWNRWLGKLKRDYLSNPWTITSLVAAFILMALTLLQTAYTIHQYYSPHN